MTETPASVTRQRAALGGSACEVRLDVPLAGMRWKAGMRSRRTLLSRSAPAASGMSSRSIIAIDEGLLSLDDRVVDVLPDRVPADVSEQGRRITVPHLPSMTCGHPAEAWEREPDGLVKGFLSLPFATAEGTRHVYDDSTTYILARMSAQHGQALIRPRRKAP
ncbi:serine hydrolase [Streptomyces sp. NRRL B-24572]|uniref:serine hydrolase n=1 Tax=Streptomyces sp. NRRL B-24572 TaxID=1962156 RepID=UPI00211AAE5D|nr:serine hydrolase [Streptomyces sp. NRRL B-24572]